MKKLILIGIVSILYAQYPDTLDIIINPASGSIADYYRIVIYVKNKATGQVDTSFNGLIELCTDGDWGYKTLNLQYLYAFKGSIINDTLRIYRAGNVYVYGRCAVGRGRSEMLSLTPLSPYKSVILYTGQNLIRGYGKGNYVPTPIYAGDSLYFRIILTDKYYNPVSGNLPVYFSSNDSVAEYFPDSLTLLDSTRVKIKFKIATYPPQFFQSSDSRFVYSIPYDQNFKGDTLSPSFQVFAGNYEKLLLVAPGERHFPGDENRGKKGVIPYLPSAIPFYLKLFACDKYHNFLKGVNDTGILVFNPPDTLIDTVPSYINLINGVDSFRTTIFRGGAYVVYGLDKNINRQSPSVILQIVGSKYISEVSPDTVLSGNAIHLKIEFVDPQGSLVPHSHPVYLTPVNASNLQPASGIITPQVVQMELGKFEGDVIYTTQMSEEIKIRITDDLGTGEHYTDKIFVAYLKAVPDTLINYPNPFGKIGSEETYFVFYLPKPADVKIYIYDLFGNLIKKIEMNGVIGVNRTKWDGRNEKGKKVSSGTYIAILKATSGAEEIIETKRLISIIR